MRTVIIIPIYKNTFEDNELLSLYNNSNVLGKYDKAIIAPESLDLSSIDKFVEENGFKIERFPDGYFKSKETYNKLCLDHEFYERFVAYDFMLICQLDAYVFYDNLPYFCSLDYDYIGAPYCMMKCNCVCDPRLTLGNTGVVGNGGLSLRKIKSFIEVTGKIDDVESIRVPEDWYFSNCNDLRKPTCEIARTFSVEHCSIELIFRYGITPMGYHDLEHHLTNKNLIPIIRYEMEKRTARKNTIGK